MKEKEPTYSVTYCRCGDHPADPDRKDRMGVCDDWHVSPVADVHGVDFTETQAHAVADLLNRMEADNGQLETELAYLEGEISRKQEAREDLDAEIASLESQRRTLVGYRPAAPAPIVVTVEDALEQARKEKA